MFRLLSVNAIIMYATRIQSSCIHGQLFYAFLNLPIKIQEGGKQNLSRRHSYCCTHSEISFSYNQLCDVYVHVTRSQNDQDVRSVIKDIYHSYKYPLLLILHLAHSVTLSCVRTHRKLIFSTPVLGISQTFISNLLFSMNL